jgi:predicted AlkP superfamily pyrophosphatase or phosphodiesterase
VKNAAVNALQNDNPDILFVDFDDVDHAGHSYGFSQVFHNMFLRSRLQILLLGKLLLQ